MADKKISQLPSASTLDGTEYTVLVQGGVNVKVQVSEISGANAIANVGDWDASVNTYPLVRGDTGGVIKKNNEFNITVSGTMGVNPVVPGLIARALRDSPGQTDDYWRIY